MHDKIRIILIPIFLILISACAHTPLKNIKSDFSLSKSSSKGVVFGSVSQSYGAAEFLLYMSNADGSWSVYKNAREQSAFFGYEKSELGNMEGKLFAFEAPAGKYRLNTWAIKRGVDVFIRPIVSPEPVEFIIENGRTTYIGNIHMEFRMGENLFGMRMVFGGLPIIKDEFERDNKLFSEKYTALTSTPIDKDIPLKGPWFKSTEVDIEVPILPNNVPINR